MNTVNSMKMFQPILVLRLLYICRLSFNWGVFLVLVIALFAFIAPLRQSVGGNAPDWFVTVVLAVFI